MYLKFRCGHCRRLGEKLIEQDRWDEARLQAIPSELTTPEKRRFADLGQISVEEQIGFRCELDKPNALAELLQQRP